MRSKKRSLNILFLILVFFIGFILLIAYRSQESFSKKTISQWEKQLSTTCAVTTVNIEQFIRKYAQNLEVVSNSPQIKERCVKNKYINEDGSYCCLENLYRIHKNDVNKIIMTGSDGKLLKWIPLPEDQMEKEVDLDSLQIFNKSSDFSSFILSHPVVINDSIIGHIEWDISYSRLSELFLDTIKIGNGGYIWMLDENGRIIAHHNNDFFGLKPGYILQDFIVTGKVAGYSLRQSKKYLQQTEAFFNQIDIKNEGVGFIIDFAHNQYSLAAYRKVNVGNKQWTLIVNLPYEELLGPMVKSSIKNFALAIFIALLLSLLFLIFYRNLKSKELYQKENAYLADLAHSNQMLHKEKERRLSSQIDGQESERQRIARELHDGIGQMLLATRLKLDELKQNQRYNEDDKLDEVIAYIAEILDETKRISNDLMPAALKELGLPAALNNLCTRFKSAFGLQIDYVTYGVEMEMPERTKWFIYRIAQEALNNIIKHAEATEANVQLLGNKEQLTLVIQDNGKGFDLKANVERRGNGLQNINDRLYILNGNINIESAPGEGTILAIKINLNGSKG